MGEAVEEVAVVAVVDAEDKIMTCTKLPALGLGIGWRKDLALMIDRRRDLGFVEIVAENERPGRISRPVLDLRDRGVAVIPHGISLSLGGADPPDPRRVEHLARLAQELDSPFVSEHLAFVRAGDCEAGHLMPLPRTREQLDILVENIIEAQRGLPVPLALENISALFAWPDAEMTDAEFVYEALERTGAHLLLDIANVHANAQNVGLPVCEFLDALPLDRLAYMHVGGGEEREGVYHDTHAHAVPDQVFDLLAEFARRAKIPAVMLERDDAFPGDAEINEELDRLAAALNVSKAANP